METTIETRTDASLVYELLLKSGYHEVVEAFPAPFGTRHYCPNSDTLALYQDWTYRYSTTLDA